MNQGDFVSIILKGVLIILITDTREKLPLTFPSVSGVRYRTETMKTGDYTAVHEIHGKEVYDNTICERKSIADCFNSFVGDNYRREKEKWERTQQLNLHYILAIEGTVTDVLQGNRYWKAGEMQESRKTGLAQLRQLCTISLKYQVQTWFFSSRKEMAFYLVEFFLASGRWLQHQKEPS